MNGLTHLAARISAQAPDVPPSAPPGAEDFEVVLGWIGWIALAMGVVGFTIVGIMMMLQSNGRMQGGGENAGRLGWVAVGCIVVAAASGLVNQFA